MGLRNLKPGTRKLLGEAKYMSKAKLNPQGRKNRKHTAKTLRNMRKTEGHAVTRELYSRGPGA